MFCYILRLSILTCLAAAAANVNVIPKYNDVKTNPLQQSYEDIKRDIYTVPSFDELTARDLLKYGAVRVQSTNSIISSQLLSDEAFNPNYNPAYEFDPDEEADLAAASESLPVDTAADKRKNVFYEVCYQDATVERKVTDWMPIGVCHSNELSDAPSSFSQGFTLSASTGMSATVKFSQLFGLSPSLSAGLSFGAQVGGSLSCKVGPGKTLQFQVMSEYITVSGAKQRRIKVSGDYKYTNGYLASMDVDDWEDVETFSQVNKGNVQIACVTDAEYLMCK